MLLITLAIQTVLYQSTFLPLPLKKKVEMSENDCWEGGPSNHTSWLMYVLHACARAYASACYEQRLSAKAEVYRAWAQFTFGHTVQTNWTLGLGQAYTRNDWPR